MGLFNSREQPQTNVEPLWERVRALEADHERLRSQQRQLDSEWAAVLERVNRAIARLERTTARQEARTKAVESPQTSEQLEAGLPEARGFAAKLKAIQGGK